MKTRSIFSVLVLLAVLASPLANAAEKVEKVEMLYVKQATLDLCPDHAPGCAQYVEFQGKRYLADPQSNEVITTLMNLEDAAEYHHVSKIAGGSVVGFIVKESGHFPSPTSEFEVFKILSISGFIFNN